MSVITSRDNPRVRRWRELARDARARRELGSALLEGEHLVAACLDAGATVRSLILGEGAAGRFAALAARSGIAPVMLSDAVFRAIVDVESPAGIAAEIALPEGHSDLGKAAGCLFLENVQDAGNVGAILRSAAAFGLRHAVLGRGCADAWSPKVLRAAMGAHFAMDIRQNAELPAAIAAFGGRIVCTVPRGGDALDRADLSGRTGWLFGAEGQGVSEPLAALAQRKVSIPMPGGAESLNVAAAAAICFYELSRRAARS
jgi:TrmH family RNA methyltransferase